jgi:hypothetical protein
LMEKIESSVVEAKGWKKVPLQTSGKGERDQKVGVCLGQEDDGWNVEFRAGGLGKRTDWQNQVLTYENQVSE